MLKLFQRKNPYEGSARALYAQALAQVRQPVFYAERGVPDSFDGRFDLLLLHLYLVVERMLSEENVGQEFNQALFDITFADMDQTLREMGIGDMGVPKHMRRMMKAFNGRMYAYKAAGIHKSIESLESALRKNLYGTLPDVDTPVLRAMAEYVLTCRAKLQAQSAHEILNGQARFA